MSVKRVTREGTTRLIKHALASSTQMTSKELAKILSTQEARISEGKRGEWTLEESHASILVDKFGQPRGAPGHYIQAEKNASITSFIEDEPEQSSRRHYETIINYLNSPKVQDKLVEKLTHTHNLGANPITLDNADKEQILSDFKRLLLSSTFKQWLKPVNQWMLKAKDEKLNYKEILTRSSSLKHYDIEILDQLPAQQQDGEDYPSESSLSVYAKNEFTLNLDHLSTISLLLIGNAINDFELSTIQHELGLDTSSSFSPKRTNISNRSTTDYVITGTIVWEREGEFKKPKTGQAASENLAFKTPDEQFIFSPNLLAQNWDLSNPTGWQLDCWTTFKVRLFINESCDYTLTIELGAQKGSPQQSADHYGERQIIIPKVSGLKLFEQLIELRQWLDLGKIPEIEIKTNIAKAGGYIPGTIVL
ncbi:MAG: hypothetical protein AB1Y25_01135 [Cycloclasticus sp.]|jgi:hypothetical protein